MNYELINHERINEDGSKTTITTNSEGNVIYAIEYTRFGSDGQAKSIIRKTEFTLEMCNEFTFAFLDGTSHTLICGEDGVDLLHLITLHGEQRLERNNDVRETSGQWRIEGINDKSAFAIDHRHNTEAEMLRNADSDELRTAIQKLNLADQTLIARLYLDEHTVSQAELSRELGIKEATMRKRVARLRESIKTSL